MSLILSIYGTESPLINEVFMGYQSDMLEDSHSSSDQLMTNRDDVEESSKSFESDLQHNTTAQEDTRICEMEVITTEAVDYESYFFTGVCVDSFTSEVKELENQVHYIESRDEDLQFVSGNFPQLERNLQLHYASQEKIISNWDITVPEEIEVICDVPLPGIEEVELSGILYSEFTPVEFFYLTSIDFTQYPMLYKKMAIGLKAGWLAQKSLERYSKIPTNEKEMFMILYQDTFRVLRTLIDGYEAFKRKDLSNLDNECDRIFHAIKGGLDVRLPENEAERSDFDDLLKKLLRALKKVTLPDLDSNDILVLNHIEFNSLQKYIHLVPELMILDALRPIKVQSSNLFIYCRFLNILIPQCLQNDPTLKEYSDFLVALINEIYNELMGHRTDIFLGKSRPVSSGLCQKKHSNLFYIFSASVPHNIKRNWKLKNGVPPLDFKITQRRSDYLELICYTVLVKHLLLNVFAENETYDMRKIEEFAEYTSSSTSCIDCVLDMCYAIVVLPVTEINNQLN